MSKDKKDDQTESNTEREQRTLEEYERLDRKAMEDARNYLPAVAVKEYPVGKFLCFDRHEWPLRYVESIEVDETGHAPYMDYVFGPGSYARKAGNASVKITMHSGQSHHIYCSRFQVDALLDALRTAWKNGDVSGDCGIKRRTD